MIFKLSYITSIYNFHFGKTKRIIIQYILTLFLKKLNLKLSDVDIIILYIIIDI